MSKGCAKDRRLTFSIVSYCCPIRSHHRLHRYFRQLHRLSSHTDLLALSASFISASQLSPSYQHSPHLSPSTTPYIGIAIITGLSQRTRPSTTRCARLTVTVSRSVRTLSPLRLSSHFLSQHIYLPPQPRTLSCLASTNSQDQQIPFAPWC